MIKVLVEGRTPSEMRENLESFFQSVREEQTAPVMSRQEFDNKVTQHIAEHAAAATAPQPDPEDTEDIDESFTPPALPPVMASALNMNEYAQVEQSKPTGDVDSRGIPWDVRIHSEGNNKLNKNGTWRQRRGVEPVFVAQVEQELLAKMKSDYQEVAAPVQHAAPITNPIAAPIAQPVAPTLVLSMVQAPAPVAPPPLPQQPVSLVHSFDTFKANLIPTLAELTKQGKLTPEYIQALKGHFGVAEIWQLDEAQQSSMFKNFCDHGLIQGVQ